jgi:phosphinothricin acetyltransferase
MSQAEATALANQSMAKVSLQTRRVSLGDLPSLPPIFNHVISNSVISFRLSPLGVDFYEDILNTTYAHDLPFLVATTLTPPTISDKDTEGVASVEQVVGYAYAIPWRASYRAYRHTVEISVYVHPQYQSVGVGAALMDALVAALRTTRVRDPTLPETDIRGDEELERPDGTGRIREVLCIMSLDTEGRDGGYGLVKFYSRWGFEQIGHMKRVGFKFERWIDVLILQVSL